MSEVPTVGDVVKALSRGENPFARVSQVTLYGCGIEGCQFNALTENEVSMHLIEHGLYAHEPSSSKSGTRQLRCSECPETFISRKLFIRHAEEEHGLFLPIFTKNFDDQKSFDEWLKYLRQHHFTEFVSRCGKKRLHNNDQLGYMHCSRDGITVTKGTSGKPGKKPVKSGKTCAAYLKIIYKREGTVEVEGCIDHTGHELKPTTEAALTKEERQLMVDWLKENVPIKEICRRVEERRRTGIYTCKSEIDPDEPNDLYANLNFPYASVSSFSTSYVNYENPKDCIHYLEQPECSIKTEESNEYSEIDTTTPQTSMIQTTLAAIEVATTSQERFVVPYAALRQIDEHSIDASESALAFFLGELAGIQKQANTQRLH